MPEVTSPADLLQQLRASAALSQQRLAELSAVSVRTIRGLETGTILEPRPSTLRALAGPLRLRGTALLDFLHAWRAAEFGSLDLDDVAHHDGIAERFLDDLTDQPQRVRDITKTCVTYIGGDGAMTAMRVSRSVEALMDDVDRLVCAQSVYPECMVGTNVVVENTVNCHPGRLVAVNDSVVAWELTLDRPLRPGSARVLHYDVSFRNAYRSGVPIRRETEILNGVPASAAVVIEQVVFTPPMLPDRVWQVFQRTVSSPDPPQRDLEVSPNGVVEIVVERPHPGAHGLRWTWPRG